MPLTEITEAVLAGQGLTREQALYLACLPEEESPRLFGAADRVRRQFRGTTIDLCSIINAKSGACSEDCSFCAQSSASAAAINCYGLVDPLKVLEAAALARRGGARRFCIVTSGRRVSAAELRSIGAMLTGVRAEGLLPCATLGLLHEEELRLLKAAGLQRYHNNLETSRSFFPDVCSTHTWDEKVETLRAARAAGLSVCSGGIFGLGETWEDRIDLAFALKELSPDSVPINFLSPIAGTRLSERPPLSPLEALRIISLYRLILPEKEIRVCGGRLQTLGELHALVFFAGADGLLTGDYLTTLGRNFEDDRRLISQCGLQPLP